MIRRACRHPGRWPETARAEVAAARMTAAGIARMRIGEFAWSRPDLGPGDLRLDGLSRAIQAETSQWR